MNNILLAIYDPLKKHREFTESHREFRKSGTISFYLSFILLNIVTVHHPRIFLFILPILPLAILPILFFALKQVTGWAGSQAAR